MHNCTPPSDWAEEKALQPKPEAPHAGTQTPPNAARVRRQSRMLWGGASLLVLVLLGQLFLGDDTTDDQTVMPRSPIRLFWQRHRLPGRQ